jgi:HSP20 family protein
MAENIGRAPVKNDTSRGMLAPFRGIEQMRRQIDRMFDDFGNGLWSVPAKSFYETEAAWRRDPGWEKMPAVDVVEKEKAYEISAELPGMSDKDIEVTVANGILLIKGEKRRRRKKRKGITTCPSGITVHSRAASRFRKMPTRAKSKRNSRKACSR